MLSQLKRFALLAMFAAPILISCGASNPLKEGYYVAAATSNSYYPLVIVRVSSGKTVTYRVSQALHGGFAQGSEVDSASISHMNLGFEIQSDGSASYTGVATQKDSQLRVRTLKMKGTEANLSEENEVSKHEVLKDELLSSISKNDAIAELRKLVTRSGSGTTFSTSQEEDCQGAFGLACGDLFQ